MNPKYAELHAVAIRTIDTVMEAGERQCLTSNPPRDPDGWVKYKPLDRFKHALDHFLNVWHHQNPELLTKDTFLREAQHGIVSGLIGLTNLDREPEPQGIVIDTSGEQE